MKKIILGLIAISMVSCKKETSIEVTTQETELSNGMYRVHLAVKDQKQLPFVFEVTSPKTLKIYNAEERIEVNEISYKNDSVYIQMPVFDAQLTAKISGDHNLKGFYTKGPSYKKVPFEGQFNNANRFLTSAKVQQPIAGNYEVTFSPNTEHSYPAKAILKDGENGKITGTFLTETGDYRFLEGVRNGNKIALSCFDGAHAFLFDAEVKDDLLVNGMFYSGNYYSEPWTAKRNDGYQLTDPSKLTFLKEGYDTMAFSFPDLNGNTVSLSDKQFQDKVVILQIMGSWCPNCLDESKYLSQFYKDNKGTDLEIIALAFENAKTVEKVTANLNRLQERIGIEYPILIAQVGSASKKKAAEKLPMLNHVLSYPTTIFMDKKGKVRKIHTGFNGPATGKKYTDFKTEFESFVTQLRSEK